MKRGNSIEQSPRRRPPGGKRRPFLLSALLASLALHLLLSGLIFIPDSLFAAKAPPPDPIPVEIVSLPPQPAAEPPAEPQAEPPPEPPPPQPTPEPQQRPVEAPQQPPPPVTPQQIVIATRDQATPPQGNEQANAAAENPADTEQPMAAPEPEEAKVEPQPAEPALAPPPPPEPPQAVEAEVEEQATEPPLAPPPPAPPPPETDQAAALPPPAPPKPEPPPERSRAEPPRPAPPRAEPPPEREVTGAIALARPQTRPRDQVTAADHRMPPMVVRPLPPGRRGNSLMPSYPSAARANGLQGRVILLVTLSEQGRPRRIDIARSSGFDQLDESAVRAVWQWRFYRTDSGPPAEATIEIPLDFRL